MDERFFLLSRKERGARYGDGRTGVDLKTPKKVQHTSESINAFLLPVAEGVVSFSQIATLCHVLRRGLSNAVNGIVLPLFSVNMKSVDGKSP